MKSSKHLDKKKQTVKRKQRGGDEKNYPKGDVNNRISYTGNLKNGVPDGVGKMIYERSDQYYGNWKDGKKEGRGTMTYHNYNDPNIMDIYNGEWKDDKKEGSGTMKYNTKYYETLPDTFYYEGKWKNDKEHGKGINIWSNGDYYKTTWENGEADTRGILKMELETGDIYEGEVHNYELGDWEPKLPNGKGKMIYTDGSVYDGEWENGVPQGLEINDTVWKSDADCENNEEIEDPISLEKIPEGHGFRLEAEPLPNESNGRCYDAEMLMKVKDNISPLYRAPFTEFDKKRIKAYKISKNAPPSTSGGKTKKSRKSRKSRKKLQ